MKSKKNYPQNIPPKKTIFGLKWPPCSVFSPFSPFTKKQFLKANEMVANHIKRWCIMGHKYSIFVFICVSKFHKYLFGFIFFYESIAHHNQRWQHVDLIIERNDGTP
jgi:hypothetical protein